MVRDKLLTTKQLLSKVFIHEPRYIESVLASFASRSNLCLLGFRGSGKTHLMECLLRTIDPQIRGYAQGYLTAELEDVFARPDISKLINGKEDVIFKKMVYARVKAFDEIQRLGIGALSALFRLMTTGTVIYLDKEEGVREFWIIATANPTEVGQDMLNIRLPEPLWDRFDGVLWVPIAKLKHLTGINGNIEKLKEALPIIWDEGSLLQLWKEVESVKVSDDIELIMTLMVRILSFCKYAQDYDASSLDIGLKRELCSKCNKQYICSRIARPPSVRSKIALMKLAKGFAYLRGSNEVDLIDIQRAFPLVFWKRLEFMDDFEVSNRLQRLEELFELLRTELIEAKEAIDLAKSLKSNFTKEGYERLRNYANAKAWISELLDDIDEYVRKIHDKLMEKFALADLQTKAKIYFIAKEKLPDELAKSFYFEHEIELSLNPKVLAKLAGIDPGLFKLAKLVYEKGGDKKIVLRGENALMLLARGVSLDDN